jgi:excisionase family DNA binding protein
LTIIIAAYIIYVMKRYLNASEIAKLLKVDRATVMRWAHQGKFNGAVQVGKSHQWRIPLSAFEEIVKHKT